MLIKVDFHCRLNFTQFTHLSGLTCENKIQDMNERHVINLKVERKQQRTGLSFLASFYASSRAFVLHENFPAN